MEFENLDCIEFRRVARKSRVSKHRAERLLLRNVLDHRLVELAVETSDQRAFGVIMDRRAVEDFRRVRQIELDAPIEQTAEQQIERRPIGFYIFCGGLETLLRDLFDIKKDIFEVALVQFEDAEADVEMPGRERGGVFYLLSGEANALLADLTDVFVAGFGGFGVGSAELGQLHHDEAAIAAVLGVELHHRMRRRRQYRQYR